MKLSAKNILLNSGTFIALASLAAATVSFASYFKEYYGSDQGKAASIYYSISDTDFPEITFDSATTEHFEFSFSNSKDDKVSEISFDLSVSLTFSDNLAYLLEDGLMVLEDFYIDDESAEMEYVVSNSYTVFTYSNVSYYEAGTSKTEKYGFDVSMSDEMEAHVEDGSITAKVILKQRLDD